MSVEFNMNKKASHLFIGRREGGGRVVKGGGVRSSPPVEHMMMTFKYLMRPKLVLINYSETVKCRIKRVSETLPCN